VIPWQAWQSTIGDATAIELKPGVWQVGDHILKRTTPLGSADPSTRLLQYCEVLAHLDCSGIPVGAPQPTDDGHPFAEYEGELYILSSYLTGPATADSPAQFEHTGAGIAKLHQALATCPAAIDSWEIHLLTGDEVTGFIDLDHLPIGPRMYDLGYYLSCGITACTEGGEAPADALERLSHPLFAGYRAVTPMTAGESAAIVPIMLSVQLILADWYLQAGNQPRADRSLRFTHWAANLDWRP
jgi:Ser/Thr protein kinase RdoA (MazF antagonist)